MKAIYFIAYHNIKFFSVTWIIKSTYFTKPIVLKQEFFSTREEREEFLNNNHYWFEKFPFVTRIYCIN